MEIPAHPESLPEYRRIPSAMFIKPVTVVRVLLCDLPWRNREQVAHDKRLIVQTLSRQVLIDMIYRVHTGTLYKMIY